MISRYLSLLVFLLLVITSSFIASGFEAGEWYHSIMNQPAWTPPAWLLAPAWAVVNVLMALAAWLIWSTGHYSRLGPLAWWALLLVLNVAWSALIFGLNRPGWALPVLGLAIGVAIFCIKAFNGLSRQSALLMVPYLGWAIFIWVLNLAIWTMNGGFLAGFLG